MPLLMAAKACSSETSPFILPGFSDWQLALQRGLDARQRHEPVLTYELREPSLN